MQDTLILGDRGHSSWSLRAWLLVEKAGLPIDIRFVDFAAAASVAEQLSAHAPARTVPTLLTADGAVVSESLAIAEELADRHPEAGLWPEAPRARATARALAAEMHAGFAALRAECPMNLFTAYRGFVPSDAVRADLARLDAIWAHARSAFCGDGPWLCGRYSVADAFYAPVATRIATYGLPVTPDAQAYVAAHLADPAFRTWRAEALATGTLLPWYRMALDEAPWPGPAA
jgi:glutathione S-transferase